MLDGFEPGDPVWVSIVGRRLMGRVVQEYHPTWRSPRVLVRMAEDFGAYKRGHVAGFNYIRLRRRDVDRRKERS